MGTTIWLDNETREALRGLQEALGTDSANATVRHLIQQPAPDARTLFARHRSQIQAILRRHHLRRLIAFGSRARGDATFTSDLDLAAELGPRASPLALLAAEAELEELLQVHVNVVEWPNAALKDVIRSEGVVFGSG